MSEANIIHSRYGLRCEKLDKPLNLGWGLDNSAVLHCPGELPTGWLCDALDQIFIAAPQLSAVALPWAEWREEPQALTLFGQVKSDIIHRTAFYSWQPFDRGLHLLVGEQQWRGAHYVQSWLRGLTHYLLLDEPRTQRTVLEPRTDNLRLFRHLEPAGYRTIKEFDFPHKRSRMVMADRHHFFTEVGL